MLVLPTQDRSPGQARAPRKVSMKLSAKQKLYLYLIHESTVRALSERERQIVFDGLQTDLREKPLDSLVKIVTKLDNPSTKGTFRKEMLSSEKYRRSKPRRVRRPQRKRGYTDQGSLAGDRTRLTREILRESLVHVRLFDEEVVRKLTELNKRGKFAEGEWIDLERFEKFLLYDYGENSKTTAYVDELINNLLSKSVQVNKDIILKR